jgi:hypothetical protein
MWGILQTFVLILFILKVQPTFTASKLKAVQEEKLITDLVKIFADNGWKYPLISGSYWSQNAAQVIRAFNAKALEAAMFKLGGVQHESDSRQLILLNSVSDLNGVLKNSRHWKRQLVVIAFMSETRRGIADLMPTVERTVTGTNSYFYLAFYTKATSLWKLSSIISTPRFKSPVANVVTFAHNGFSLVESYDLAGEEVLHNTLDFPPYVFSEECWGKRIRPDCDMVGLFIVYLDVMARLYNFTVVTVRDPSLMWGSVRYENGSFGGTMGAIVNGDADVSASTWLWNTERDPYMDLVPVFFSPLALALTPKQPDVDLMMLLRPFTRNTWIFILVMLFAIFVVLIVPNCMFINYENTDAHLATVTAGWFFFTLINAYYSGALTMFFASEMTLPFSSMSDVLKEYPDWKVMILSGNEAMYTTDPVLYTRIKNKPGKKRAGWPTIGATSLQLRY